MGRLAALVVVVALVGATAAAAKRAPSASVCGASGCRAADPSRLSPVNGRFALRKEPRPAPYYAIFIAATAEQPFCWRMIWVPSRQLLRLENVLPYVPGAPVAGRYWRSVDRGLARNLESGVSGVRPYSASQAWHIPSQRCR